MFEDLNERAAPILRVHNSTSGLHKVWDASRATKRDDRKLNRKGFFATQR